MGAVVEYPKVCNLVLPEQAQGRPSRVDLAPIHVYRDAVGDMSSIEVDGSDKTVGKKIKIRKDKKSDIVKLCLEGYQFALMGDLPASISNDAEQAKSSILSEAINRDEYVNLRNANLFTGDHAKLAWGLSALPSNFSITRINGVFYGNIVGAGVYFNTSGFYTTTIRPAWASTQWLVFNMTPNGFSASNDHIAVTLFLTSSVVTSKKLIGNGFIIGNNSAYQAPRAPNIAGCVTPPVNTQIEAFWDRLPTGLPNGNAVYSDTCAPFAVPDNVSSSYGVHANIYQDVMYQRSTAGQTYTGTKNTSGQQPHVTLGGFNPNEGGVLISGVFEDPQNPNYTVTFSNVNTGWF